MLSRNLISITAVIALAGGVVACDKMKGMVGGGTDFRNAQIDVSNTPCSADGKFSTLLLKDGKFELAQYQFEVFGETKSGDVSGHTTATDTNDSVFVGNCANNGQTSQVLFVYGPDGKRLGTADLTGNSKGLVQSYDVKDSTILVEQNQGNPPQLSKTNYALLNGKLVDTATGEPAAVAVNTTDTGDVDTISYQSFHDKLQPYGKWVQHPRWGLAWHPVAANFRPYENGHWEDSDEYGSIWVSADPWGDTPYHYGRWGYDPNYGGWLWVPGYVWGPSWVTWRADEDNLGWFPIPPGEWDGEGDYPDYWASWYGYEGVLDVAAFYGLWSFVPAVDIFAGNIRGRIIDRRGYGRLIGRTRGWGHIGLAHGHIVNRAFDRGRFASNFHRGFPGNMRHDFHDRGLHTVAAGRGIAAHERIGGGGVHVGIHERIGSGMSGMHRETGFNRTGSNHSHGFTRSGSGFPHSGNGFSRSGNEGGGFARTGSYNHASGFSRSGGGTSGGGMFGHNNGGGFSRSDGGTSGGGMFGHNNGGGFSRNGGGTSGGGMFGRNNGGGGASGGGGGMSGHGNTGGGGMGGGGGMFGHSNGGGSTPSHASPSSNSKPSSNSNSGGGGHHHH